MFSLLYASATFNASAKTDSFLLLNQESTPLWKNTAANTIINNDGIIVSSKILNSGYDESELDKYFDHKSGEEGMILYGGETAPLSYQYTKKKID